jgi:uncharacterized membrane protein YeaQ/YmgE (transglycosylase-associated protein family)
MAITLWIIIGLIAGWFATQLFSERGGGTPHNFSFGLIGAVGGGFLFTHLSPAQQPSFFGSLLTAIVGAAVVLLVWRVIRRA